MSRRSNEESDSGHRHPLGIFQRALRHRCEVGCELRRAAWHVQFYERHGVRHTVRTRTQGATSQRDKALAWIEQNEEITPIAADYRLAALMKAMARTQGA